MQEYIAMWKNYANFSGRTSVRGYWMALLFNFIISGVLTAITGALPALAALASVYSLAALIPGLAINVRRLRDAGYSWTSLLWVFVPLVGLIILIVRLCKKSTCAIEDISEA